MTTKALGQLAQKFISQADQHQSNGQELWKALDSRYLNKEQSSILLQEGLTTAYNALRMQPSKSMFNFAHRYDVAYGKLIHNNMDVRTGAALTLHFIKAINKPAVFASLKTKLQLPSHSHYITSNIKQLGRALETYHDIHVQAYALEPSHPPATAPSPAPAPTPAPAPSAPQQQQSSGSSTGQPANTPTRPPDILRQIEQFKVDIAATPDPTTFIITTHNACYNTTKCAIHTIRSNHDFINCTCLKGLCREICKSAEFEEAKARIRVATSATPTVPTPTPTPAPPPAPTPAPMSTPAPAPSIPVNPYQFQQPYPPPQFYLPPNPYYNQGGFNQGGIDAPSLHHLIFMDDRTKTHTPTLLLLLIMQQLVESVKHQTPTYLQVTLLQVILIQVTLLQATHAIIRQYRVHTTNHYSTMVFTWIIQM